MTSLPRWKKLVSLLRNNLFWFFLLAAGGSLSAQQLAAFHDNQGRFFIFDNGRTIQAEYLAVTAFSIGGRCIIYADNRNNLKMYYEGKITTLEVNGISEFKALDYLSVYSLGGIVKIIEEGKVSTISTNSIRYQAEDSLVTFYDTNRQLLAVFYKGRIHILEDGLTGKPYNLFRSGDNMVAYVSARSGELKVFITDKPSRSSLLFPAGVLKPAGI